MIFVKESAIFIRLFPVPYNTVSCQSARAFTTLPATGEKSYEFHQKEKNYFYLGFLKKFNSPV